MESKVKKLVDECTKKIDLYNYKNIVKWSFIDDFKKLQDIPLFDEVNNAELKQFIEICDNRLDRAKTFLNDIAVVLGFDLLSLSIVVPIAIEGFKLCVIEGNKTFNLLPYSGIVIGAILLVILIILFLLLAYYRSQIHAWTAFKEEAILMRKTEKETNAKKAED